jgi:hypothetical protein
MVSAPGLHLARNAPNVSNDWHGRSPATPPTCDMITLEAARAAAHAEFDIAQVRQVKVAVIEHMRTIGECDAPPSSLTTRQTRM